MVETIKGTQIQNNQRVGQKLRNKRERYLLEKCYWCKGEILVKYNTGTGKYAKKNDWYYWTEKKENENKYICNACLLNFYYNQPKEYLKAVENKRKRRIFTTYVYNGTIQ